MNSDLMNSKRRFNFDIIIPVLGHAIYKPNVVISLRLNGFSVVKSKSLCSVDGIFSISYMFTDSFCMQNRKVGCLHQASTGFSKGFPG